MAIASIEVQSGGLASSGDYERYSEIDGKRYGHIINPATGWPVSGLASVSVLAPSCLVAGSVSTVAMLAGVDDGLSLLHESGLPWLAIHSDFRVEAVGWATSLPTDYQFNHRYQIHEKIDGG